MKRIVPLLLIFLPTFVVCCVEVPAYQLKRGDLFPDGQPVGQPISSSRTHIRMVRVSSIYEADSFFVALCQNHQLNYQYRSRDSWHYRNETTGGEIIYTHKVPSGSYEVGIIYIQDSIINAGGIKEVHFVETIKSVRLQQK